MNEQGIQTNVNPTAITSSASSTASLTAPIPATPSTTFQASSSGSSGLSTGAKAGIGAGVGAAVLIAAIVAAYWYIRRKKQRSQNHQKFMAEQIYNGKAPPQHRSSELQVAGSGKDYRGPTIPRELESTSPSRTDGNTRSSTTVVEMG